MRKILFPLLFVVAFLPFKALAFNVGDNQTFNVEPSFDSKQREKTVATLRAVSNDAYFYVDDNWWSALSADGQSQAALALGSLGEAFDGKIYPTETQTWGDVWNPGIDKDTRITVLFIPMKEASGGYFNSGDEQSKSQVIKSNEREMVYLNADQILNPILKALLTHEFQHLINYNQKERLRGVIEDVWLNEARSEYSVTLLGYDSPYPGSNLERRVRNFLDKPYDSLVDWSAQPADYGVVNLFTQYLVDHYGVAVLQQSLWSSKTGVDSLNSALKKINAGEDFAAIFTDWTVAVFLNDCSLDSRYCYFESDLRQFRVVPQANFLPPLPKTSLSVTNTTKVWAGNWYKFFGGKGNLTLDFSGGASSGALFKIPYFLQDPSGRYQVSFLTLNSLQNGQIPVPDFGQKYLSLVIAPSLQAATAPAGDSSVSTPFSWTVLVEQPGSTPLPNPAEIENLLAKIADLKNQIALLQEKLAALQGSCQSFSRDLYFGWRNSDEVRCLQTFLKSRGASVYPEGLVTGNYLAATRRAVQRYQSSKGITATGYFGAMTRQAANLDKKEQ